MKEIIQPYKSDFSFSYTSGAYATIEMLKSRPQVVRAVYLHSSYHDDGLLRMLCEGFGVPTITDDKAFKRINQKENAYVLGVFDKYETSLSEDFPHIVLVNPCDMGNLGTIIRTIAGMNLCQLAIITPAADIWNPKTLRASMGALFRISFEKFSSCDEYCSRFPKHEIFTFMLDGILELSPDNCPKSKHFSLVFGNEASGLDGEFRKIGTSVKIKQTGLIDSLNISIAVGIGTFLFADRNGII